MASVNKVILLGNLGRDPETRYTADGAAITNVAASHALYVTQSDVVSDVIVTAAQNAAGSSD